MNDLTQIVMTVLSASGTPLSLLEIAQASYFRMPRIVNAVDLLIDQGRIEVFDGVPARYRLKVET